jgi:hypothetical protein
VANRPQPIRDPHAALVAARELISDPDRWTRSTPGRRWKAPQLRESGAWIPTQATNPYASRWCAAPRPALKDLSGSTSVMREPPRQNASGLSDGRSSFHRPTARFYVDSHRDSLIRIRILSRSGTSRYMSSGFRHREGHRRLTLLTPTRAPVANADVRLVEQAKHASSAR